jgi:hypothetical protein
MNLLDRLYAVFREKNNALMQDIESALFLFIEEIIISKNIPMDGAIDYNSPAYQTNLKVLLNSIEEGLASLKFPRVTIKSYLMQYYPTFSKQMSYVDWIMREFQPKIQKILFCEILKHLSSHSSNLRDLVSLGVLNAGYLTKLDQIRKENVEYNDYFEWYFRLMDTFVQKVTTNELDFRNILQFDDPERCLQSVYIVFRIMELMELQNHLDLTPVIRFLTQSSEKWGVQNLNISEKYPMTIFAGLYLLNYAKVQFDLTNITENIKKILVNLVNNFTAPIYEDTYLTYYTIRACKILGLKLSEKLITGLLRYDEKVINIQYLRNMSTARLGTIYRCFRDLNALDKMHIPARNNIKEILETRTKDRLFYDYDIDFLPMSEAILGGVDIVEFENALNVLDLKALYLFIARNIKENLFILDFGLTGQLSDIYYALKVLDRFDGLQDKSGIKLLHQLLFRSQGSPISTKPQVRPSPSVAPSLASTPAPIEAPITSWADNETEFDPFQDSGAGQNTFIPKPEFRPQVPEVEKLPQTVKPVPVTPVEPPPKVVIDPVGGASPAPSAYSSSVTLDSGEPLPTHLWDFFGKFPALHSDIIDELRLNMVGIGAFRESIFNSLNTLHNWIVCLRVLNLEIPVTGEEVFRRTAIFRKTHGFGIEGDYMPDPQNTFYGLAIYAEMGLMNRIDLYAIQKYLIAETQRFDENFVLINDYTMMALRLLEKQGIVMGDLSSLVSRVSNWNAFKATEQYDIATDFIHCINLLRTINPMGDYSHYNEKYLNAIKTLLMENGSIQNRITDTAKSLLVLTELGLKNTAEAKFMIRFLQYETRMFADVVAQEPLGWMNEGIGYELELKLAYWTLLALTVNFPMHPPPTKAIVCPGCRKYFNQKPRFCNNCGHRF